MNEEIFKRLQDQCWIYNTHPDMVDDEGRPCGFDTKKFALLLVRECLNIADKEHKLALEFEWDNDDTATSIKDSIKKHFGVDNNSV